MNNNFFRTLLTVIVLIVLAGYGYSSWKSYQPNTSGPRQVIFLADGQSYFGYASSMRNRVVILTGVYYLQTPVGSQANGNTTPATQEVNLVKLGEELHGPQDKMYINRDRITFIEDMKDDSQVNQKIKEHLEKK